MNTQGQISGLAAQTTRRAPGKAKRAQGFTLVELIAVVAIIALIAVYITIEINQSNDDAKVGLATAFLASSVPGAISSYKSRNLGSCRGIELAAAAPGETLRVLTGETTTASTTKQRLVARGLSPTTVWDDFWTVAYADGTRRITITYPLNGSNNVTVGPDLARNLSENPQVISATFSGGTSAAESIAVTYGCS